ncbi:tyrosine-protein kinase family protein [Metallosphaera hakonensis]|uniref:ATPase n=1 Tax=Metallosphaera hakonensis JCM 8857 = DSM 7519 TaxID=1293036 RepID=A0A2U9IQZ5_9CREN|nr:P-loop NTPase [Metallosphaera hakonensis]AWR98468.1 P-loop NTPase [Metallosphaera hakonensis JCM 8857 = DSM 7519]
MRISIRSSKGGVGKSTIAISLAKALAMKGYDVLLMDRDVVGYASYLAGIQGLGLVANLSEGKEIDVIRDFQVGDGSFTVLKYFGDGPRYRPDLGKIHANKELMNKGWEYYREFLTRKKYSFFIVDNAPMVMPKDEINVYEMEQFTSMFPHVPIKYIMVSDGLKQTIDDNIRYAKSLQSEIGENLGFVINMIKPDSVSEYRGVIGEIVRDMRFKIGALIPFYSELFQYTGDIQDFPVITQVKQLAEKIESGSEGVVE